MNRIVARAGLLCAAVVLGGMIANAQSKEKSMDMELIEIRKIWDAAPHNAFTDLIRFGNHWYCAFREGQAHVSKDGQLRVIRSADGEKWASVALMKWADGDVRDAKLSITAAGQLLLNGAVTFSPKSPDMPQRRSITWLSNDGEKWTGPHECDTGVNTWRWSMTWQGGYGYSLAYSGKDSGGHLYRTRDGREWVSVASNLFPKADNGYGNEAALVFCPDDTAYCLLRRDPIPYDTGRHANAPGATAMLGTAKPPYTEWTWKNLGLRIGGPKIIRLRNGRLLAAVRLYRGRVRTSLCWVDPDQGTLAECLKLPSGGDCSYAGLVEHDGLLWVSYYSSHEGKTAIYLAKVKINHLTHEDAAKN